MSFQDVGKRHSQRNTVNASMGSTQNRNRIPTATQLTPPKNNSAGGTSVFASMSISAATATTQISDSLTQYQVRTVLYP